MVSLGGKKEDKLSPRGGPSSETSHLSRLHQSVEETSRNHQIKVIYPLLQGINRDRDTKFTKIRD